MANSNEYLLMLDEHHWNVWQDNARKSRGLKAKVGAYPGIGFDLIVPYE
jgi:hypothetical protein